ncbi:MAG TPA: endonuclease/exonuclease/phosphatase family protein, partial [Myxococcaceae bacterium]|nr:endonuclease/exonuclease/phosphatase family protein [Myxococcaceae bacterium]
MKLTAVSYNIHSGVGTDGRFDLRRTEGVLQQLGADIFALQEVGELRGRRWPDDQPERLASDLGLQMAFGPTVIRSGRRYGNAILTRLKILRSRNYDL